MAATQTEKRTTRTATAVRFPEELHERLRQAADSYGLPLNFVVVKAMEDFLDRMIPPSEFRLTRDRSNDCRRRLLLRARRSLVPCARRILNRARCSSLRTVSALTPKCRPSRIVGQPSR